MIPVDYSDKESVKSALTGIDVVISTIAQAALRLQEVIAVAAKEAGVKLFVPSEFGPSTEDATEGHFAEKAGIQGQLKAVGIPYALFYTGAFADFIWQPCVASFSAGFLRHFNSQWCRSLGLDVTNGKVYVGGDGNKQIPFTSRTDIARYVSYVLTHLPAEQLNNRSFCVAGDTKVCH